MAGARRSAVFVLLTLAGCATVPSRTAAPGTEQTLPVPFARAWAAAVEALTERGYPPLESDEGTGGITTVWFPVEPDYRADAFVGGHPGRYSDCGRPGFWHVDRGKRGQLRLQLRPDGDGRTILAVTATFKTTRFAAPILFPVGAGRPVTCASTGRLENEVLLWTGWRLLRNALQGHSRSTLPDSPPSRGGRGGGSAWEKSSMVTIGCLHG